MTKQLLGIAAGVALTAALHAQGGGRGGGGGGFGGEYQFQQAGTLATYGGDVVFRAVGGNGTVVVARPFSATEERKSVQKFPDGLEISTSDNRTLYRDSQGRTRVDTVATNTVSGAQRVTVQIADPVSRVTITLNPDTKIARRVPIMGEGLPALFSSGVRDLIETMPRSNATAAPAARGGAGGGGVVTGVAAVGVAAVGGRGGRGAAANHTVVEDLGAQSLNGVVATGTRRTLTIPQGTIGNNRDINVVNERWYSEDLQMLVKSVNSDPRFGEDTYQLSNISRTEPDPSLFLVPAGYTVTEVGGRGGRGGAVQPAMPQQTQGTGGGGQNFQAPPPPVIK